MPWTQVYNPLGNLLLSALVAALPVVVLLGLLGWLHVKAHIAALLGLATALLVAIFVFGMPSTLALSSAGYGALYGLFPIGWIVLCAIFIYDISVKTGQFEVVKRHIASLANDRRVQALLIAFSFGAFIEGAAGFGTPVAISAAMLIGLGFNPLLAAGVALIGNTAPVAYGALGTPIIALSSVTGIDIHVLSAMVGRQLPFFSLLVPFWLVWAMAGRKGMLEVWPACLTAGLSFAICQFLVSNFHGPWLVDIVSSIVSMASLVVLLRFWQPKNTWRFPGETAEDDFRQVRPASPTLAGGASGSGAGMILPARGSQSGVERRAALRAWTPWIMLTVFVFAWGLPQVKEFLNGGAKDAPNFLSGISQFKWAIPGLDKMILRDAPIVAKPAAEAAIFTFNWLSA
ncbi:MAG: lactate permease LctP family transporter, partial [Chloroflexaceae bacterium]|nr:lactate permease LctP family transporter [Chloroflexaceae bacterium]